jgi:hypothetical protein
MLKLWVIALGLSGLLPLASVSQKAGGGVETPSEASVSVKSPQRLVPGQNFESILRLDRAPHGYGPGQILCKFQLTSPARSETPPEGDQKESNQSTELVNDLAEYRLSLPVTHSMLPGTWKLTEVTLVGGARHPVSIRENVTFEVYESPLPIGAKVIWGKSQRLGYGDSFDFEVSLETAPEGYNGGGIHYRFELIKSDPQESHSPSDGYLSFVEGDVGLNNGQSTYKVPVPIVQIFQDPGFARHQELRVMSPGEWKLVKVTLGQRVKKPVLNRG